MSSVATLAMPVAIADRRGSVGGTRGGPTLDEHIVGVWEAFAARGAAPCPVCEIGTLRPALRAHARPASGRCDVCGSELG
jgi:hypothetical protein